jgi:hypothetical protein
MFGSLHGIAPPGGWGIFGDKNDMLNWNEPGPQYFTLVLWSKMGNTVLNAVNSNNASTTMSVWATKKKTGELQVMVINKTKAAITETISFTGFNPSSKVVDIYEYRSASNDSTDIAYSYNGKSSVAPATTDLPPPTSVISATASYTRAFPAYSGTVLDFTNRTTAIADRSRRSLPDAVTVGCIPGATGASVVVNGPASFANSRARVTIFDVSGHQIASITKPAGSAGSIVWNRESAATGAYIVVVATEGMVISRTVNLFN